MSQSNIEQLTELNSEVFDLGSIVLTKDSIFVGWGKGLAEPDFKQAPSQVTIGGRSEIKGTHIDQETKRLATDQKDLNRAVDIIFQNAPNVTHICISGSGPFRLLGKRYRDDPGTSENYGRMLSSTTQPEWSEGSIYESTLSAIKSSKFRKSEWFVQVLVALDVNTSALGEHYYILDQQFNPENLDYHLKWGVRTTAYVKISNSVNVGFISNGWMNRGRGHAQMSVFRPRKTKLINGKHIIDRFPGICPRHGDCIEGLTRLSAIAHRLKAEGYPVDIETATLEEMVEIVGLGHPVWIWTAYYISQLIQITTAMVSPWRIALGGVIATGPHEDRANGWPEFIDMIKHHFVAELWSDAGNQNPITPSPHFREITRPDFISYRACRFPGVFGGLIAARWDKTSKYPSPVQYILNSPNPEFMAP